MQIRTSVPEAAAFRLIEALATGRRWRTLRQLAAYYRHRANLASRYAHILECAERLKLARESYDRLLVVDDDQAAELEAEGVGLFESYSGDSVPLLPIMVSPAEGALLEQELWGTATARSSALVLLGQATTALGAR